MSKLSVGTKTYYPKQYFEHVGYEMSQTSSVKSKRSIFSSRSSSRLKLGKQFNRGTSHKERFNEQLEYGLDDGKTKNLLSKQALEEQIEKNSFVSKKSSVQNNSSVTASKQSVLLSRSKVRNQQITAEQPGELQSLKSIESINLSLARSLIRRVIDAPAQDQVETVHHQPES